MSEQFARIRDFFKKENIECYSVLPIDKATVINERLMPKDAKSVVIFLIPYYTNEYQNRNVSLYAVSRDYHLYIKQLQSRFSCDDGFYRFFADTSPIDERQAALYAGLGVKGQNRLLINEKYGSYIFLGSIITDVVFDEDEYAHEFAKKDCKNCGLCKKNCAFLGGKRDFCLSELNQRKKVTDEELSFIRSHKIIWGCDDCQTVCPYNKDIPVTPIEFFHKDTLPCITQQLIENMSDEIFKERAYSWRGKNVILRNLAQDGENK